MKFKMIKREQLNPYYDVRTQNNGGGYDQPLLVYSAGEYTLEIADENIGDFGEEYSVTLYRRNEVIAEYTFCNRENDCRNGEWSTFDRSNQAHRGAAEFAASIGYPISFESEVGK